MTSDLFNFTHFHLTSSTVSLIRILSPLRSSMLPPYWNRPFGFYKG